jgi:DNA repair and recombination protein RAD54B
LTAPKKSPAGQEFKTHKDAANLVTERKEVVKVPRYDPDAPGALVLSRLGSVPVVVDPHLSKQLRPHQRVGVQFMYDCLMGVRQYDGSGCILADEMGLGKTLQAVTLVWTFLKSGPEADPIARKVAIVTPTSLVRNWLREFKRWLGSERVQPLTVDDAKNKAAVAEGIEEFFRLNKHKVLILSYETFRAHKDLMTTTALDLLILDEGHRIVSFCCCQLPVFSKKKRNQKNVTAQISKALAQVKTRRRVLLTGTPLQNDLKEFYAMVDFCNPSILGSVKFFSEFFDKPIIQSRDISMSDQKREAGEKKFQELAGITNMFMLRRTNQILEDYLPPKSEQVVFCRPSESQVLLYRFFLGSKTLRQAMAEGAGSSSSLECISLLTKLCNYPGLVRAKALEYLEQQAGDDVPLGKKVDLDCVFPEYDEEGAEIEVRPDLSGKLSVLDGLLSSCRSSSDDRAVVVSNFTATLDVIQRLCVLRGWKYFRLDGKTEQTKRQTLETSFSSIVSLLKKKFCFKKYGECFQSPGL